MSNARYWLHLTTADFAELPKGTIALLPVGATEQHGPHMPVGTDTLINQGIVARLLELVDPALSLVVLPTQPVGTSTEHLAYPGTLSHDPSAIMGIWTTILEDVVRAGITKLILFNSHGGQTRLLQPVALQIRQRHGALAAYASWFDAGYPAGLFDDDELNFGIHAGAIETSMMLHLHPDLVRRDRMIDFPSTAAGLETEFRLLQSDPGNGRMGGFGWMMQDLNPYGAAGDARISTAEAGRSCSAGAGQSAGGDPPLRYRPADAAYVSQQGLSIMSKQGDWAGRSLGKDALRNAIWAALETSGFAMGETWSHIPNFVGADIAAWRLAQTDAWKNARTVKVNPDPAQYQLRLRALYEGKTLFCPVPALTQSYPYLRIDAAELKAKGISFELAATHQGYFQHGTRIEFEDVPPLDFCVVGSVGVSRSGGRTGKGAGFADIETGIFRELGTIGPKTPIATTVHSSQVVGDEQIVMMEHDSPLDFIATEGELIITGNDDPRPKGISWDAIQPDQFEAIPFLRELQKRSR